MQHRIDKILKNLPSDFEALLITSSANKFYFLGMDSHDAGKLLIVKNKAYFIIDGRYLEVFKKNVTHAEIILQGKMYEQIDEILKANNVKNLHIDDTLTLSEFNTLKEKLNYNFITDDTATKAMQECRNVKEEIELDCIYKAQEITDKAYEYMLTKLQVGKTEKEMQLELDYFMLRNGADALAFDTILVSGKNTSLPHGVPSDKKIEYGDFITMDFGAKVGGYCTDMTRTVAMGEATQEMKDVYAIVLEAQVQAVQAVKAGCGGSQVDAVARDIIKAKGYGVNFCHSTGHGTGIEIHEFPYISESSKNILPENCVMTVEPGIYIAGKFGIRIEDTVIVKENGYYVHGKTDKNLTIIKANR